MTQDDLIRVAHDAGLWPLLRNTSKTKEAVERFAKMLTEQEREACAALCDDIGNAAQALIGHDDYASLGERKRMWAAKDAAARIRARSTT